MSPPAGADALRHKDPTISRLRLGTIDAVSFAVDDGPWAIVLPGAGYSVQAPLLWYARRVAVDAGRNVLAILDRYDAETHDPRRWVIERCAATLEHLRDRDPRPLLITKSLTSLAAPIAAREGLPAVWFTPLISEAGSSVAADVRAGLETATAPRLLIGGSADPTWDASAATGLRNAAVLELPGADHSLEVPGDLDRSLRNLSGAISAVRRFIRKLS